MVLVELADPTNKILKNSMFKNDTLYCFNVSPSDAHQHYRSNSINRFNDFYKSTFSLFEKYVLDYAEIDLVPEISSKGRIHFHGTIKFTDSVTYHLVGAYHFQQATNIDIDTIDNIDNWNKYKYKDKSLMSPFLKKLKLPYKITNSAIRKYSKKQSQKGVLTKDITSFYSSN